MNSKICFSQNTAEAFRDYMFDYMTNQEHKEGYSYNTEVKFAEKEKLINEAILGDIERLAGFKFEQENVAPEMMAQNPTFCWAAFAVVNQLIDTITPDVLNNSLGIFSETRFGGFGDSFRFDVESNDLFFVSKVGRNQKSVEFQRQYAGTQYVVPEARAITVGDNLFRALCGLESLAKFVMKAILSVTVNMEKEAYTAINTAMEALPTTPDGGALKITAAGGVVDKTAAIKLVQAVTAYNSGRPAMFVGTKVALSHLFPAADSGFRYDDASIAYYRNVWGVDTLELKQIADINNKYKLALDDNKIYVISPSSDKLLKICYEGATMANNILPTETANGTGKTTIRKSYGMAVATNAVAGLITLE